MTNLGFVKLHRSILNWEWYDDINTKIVFFHLLLKANFENKKWKGQEIKRGSLITSREKLAKEIGLTIQQTRSCLNKLKSTSEITIKTTSQFTLITIENYRLYQNQENENNQQNNQQTNHQITNEQPTNNQQITITKEIKEIKERKNNNTVEEKSSTPIVKKPKFDDFHFSVAKTLGDFLRNKQQRNIRDSQIDTWAKEIRLLMENDIPMRADPKADVIKAMQSVLDKTGEPYFPEIQSGKSFREKFNKIENYIKRGNNGNYKKTDDIADTYYEIAAGIDAENKESRCSATG